MPAIADGPNLTGFKELSEKLQRLADQVSKKAQRRALAAGAVVVREDARRRVSVRSGSLRKSIVSGTRQTASTKEVYGYVTIAAKAFRINKKGKAKVVSAKVQKARNAKYVRGEIYPRNYAHLVEFGTSPHSVRSGATNSGVAGFLSRWGAELDGRLHPGARQKPFMRPAVDSNGEQISAAIEKVLRAAIEKEAR